MPPLIFCRLIRSLERRVGELCWNSSESSLALLRLSYGPSHWLAKMRAKNRFMCQAASHDGPQHRSPHFNSPMLLTFLHPSLKPAETTSPSSKSVPKHFHSPTELQTSPYDLASSFVSSNLDGPHIHRTVQLTLGTQTSYCCSPCI